MRTFLLALVLTLPLFARTADLKVQSEAGPSQPVPVGHYDQTVVNVHNAGPGTAMSARLTITLPEGSDLRDVWYDVSELAAARCPISGTTAVCSLGDMPAGSYRQFRVNAEMPVAVGTFSIVFRASSDTPDPMPDDNTALTTYTTENRTAIYVSLRPVLARTEAGDAVQIEAQLSNQFPTLPGARFSMQLTAVNGTIETIDAPAWQCSINGASAECAITAATSRCCPEDKLKITVRTNPGSRGGETTLTVATSAGVPDQGPGSVTATIEIYRHITVTSTADSGPGTLRAAFDEANEYCAAMPCKIDFAIGEPVPAEGWFTIVPETPLPVIRTSRVILDGSTQTKLTGDTNPKGPEVAVDGRNVGLGLEIHAACDATVKGLALGNFEANQALWVTQDGPRCVRWQQHLDRVAVTENHIGVDPTGTAPWPNLRGLRLDDARDVRVTKNVIGENRRSGVWMWRGSASFHDNRIERNGASGIFLGPEVSAAEVLRNTINGHPHMGVAVARGAQAVDIRQNSMRGNSGLGIDWGLDGPSPIAPSDTGLPSNAPVLLAAVYDAAKDETVVTMTLHSDRFAPFSNAWVIDFYANDGPDGDGETFVVEGTFWGELPAGSFTMTMKGNYLGKWINATSTRVHWLNSLREPGTQSYLTGTALTSELSNTVLVSP